MSKSSSPSTPRREQLTEEALRNWYERFGHKYLQPRNYELSASGKLEEALAIACRRVYGEVT